MSKDCEYDCIRKGATSVYVSSPCRHQSIARRFRALLRVVLLPSACMLCSHRREMFLASPHSYSCHERFEANQPYGRAVVALVPILVTFLVIVIRALVNGWMFRAGFLEPPSTGSPSASLTGDPPTLAVTTHWQDQPHLLLTSTD